MDKNTKTLRAAAVALTMALALGTTAAQPKYRYHNAYPKRPYVVRTLVSAPVSNTVTKKDRLAMALAYLNKKPTMTVNKYAKLTGLPVSMAEAELEAFAIDRRSPIVVVAKGKKRLYTLRG